MKLSTSLFSNPVKEFNVQPKTEFSTQKQSINDFPDLHDKHDDEPDFDCEFLHVVSQAYNENESTLDLESEDDLEDEYNDNEWDIDIYDPYLESTYF